MSRPVPAPQPDLTSRLLAAVAERDPGLASRLGQQWVHRRGLAALDRFLLTTLAPSQGQDAVQWLRGQLGLIEDQAEPAVVSATCGADQPVNHPPMLAEEPIEDWELEERCASRTAALFGRMTARLRQCLEEAIVGIDGEEDEAPHQPEPLAQPEAVGKSAGAGPGPTAPEPARRLMLVPPFQASASPAPAPASLAALRAWLPDGEEDGRDLPSAC